MGQDGTLMQNVDVNARQKLALLVYVYGLRFCVPQQLQDETSTSREPRKAYETVAMGHVSLIMSCSGEPGNGSHILYY